MAIGETSKVISSRSCGEWGNQTAHPLPSFRTEDLGCHRALTGEVQMPRSSLTQTTTIKDGMSTP